MVKVPAVTPHPQHGQGDTVLVMLLFYQSGQSRRQALVHPSLWAGLVATASLWLGLIKIKSNQIQSPQLSVRGGKQRPVSCHHRPALQHTVQVGCRHPIPVPCLDSTSGLPLVVHDTGPEGKSMGDLP